MAKVVLGFASSHGPTIKTLPGEWDRIAERDMKDPRYDYQELLRNANPAIANEITLQKKQERYDKCQVGIKKLAEVVARSASDVAVVVSNPHGIPPDDPKTVFGNPWGVHLSGRPAERPGQSISPEAKCPLLSCPAGEQQSDQICSAAPQASNQMPPAIDFNC